jgi:hypothetical protein
MRTALYLIASMVLVVAITFVAGLWVHISHTRIVEGELLTVLWGSHGIHTVDLLVLGVELGLVTILSITLFIGFTRRP